MAKPNARPTGMAMVSKAARARHLIAMGCSTRHTKDFIQLLNTAKKMINFIMASIILYIRPPNSTAPERSNAAPPCVPRRSNILSYPSPITSALIWLVVVCSRRLAAA